MLTVMAMRPVTAQLFINSNQQFTVTNGGIVTVLDMDLINKGNIDHAGDIEVRGNIINSVLFKCDNLISSSTSLTLAWTNDSTFQSGIGTVYFSGTNQIIQGTHQSAFYDLVLRGNKGHIKTQLANAGVRNSLNLGQVELATNGNQFSLWDARISILRTVGYISTFKEGKVKTHYPNNHNGISMIPLGFGTKSSEFKPFFQVQSGRDSFDVTLYGHSSSVDGRDVNSMDDTVCAVNPYYYFRYRTYSTPSYYGFTRDNSESKYTKIGYWNASKWDRIVESGPSEVFDFDNLAQNSQLPNSNKYITHVSEKPFVDAGSDISLRPYETRQLDATGYFPLGTFYKWTPSVDLSCAECLNPYFRLGNPGKLYITADNGSGCIAIDSLNITTENGYIYIPNAFTPNGDNLNEGFGPVLGRNEVLENIKIYNRWGEKLHDSDKPWNGFYQGELVMEGVYVYKARVVRDMGRNEVEKVDLEGTVTLLR